MGRSATKCSGQGGPRPAVSRPTAFAAEAGAQAGLAEAGLLGLRPGARERNVLGGIAGAETLVAFLLHHHVDEESATGQANTIHNNQKGPPVIYF